MKKIFNYIMLLVVAISGLTLTACSEDNLDTNQYRGGVSLSAYGPQPVMRGGYLRFLGSNLDQIREIQIPGVDPITNIEVVQAGEPSEIRIVVPKDGPEPGFVTLISKSDEKIVTKTKLSYDEPISIESVTETAMPGDVIEIKGDYLNLIHMIEFAKEVWVSEESFVSHDRYSIKVRVPENARTGILNLYTADLTKVEDPDALTYNIIPTEKALIVGTPTVAKLASPRGTAEALGNVVIKLGEELSITGEYFQLVDSVKFGGEGNDSVYVKALTVAEDGKSIKLTLPAEAPDGPVNLVAKSGVEIPAGTITTVAPSECVAAPSPVKAGQALTITGKDLDVVASVTMDGAGDVEFTYADGKITIKAVPETAVDGNANLIMKNGKSTPVAYTLVKPEAKIYSSNPVSAGGALTITGTNLDLVKTITFNESETPVEVTAEQDGTVIKLTVPMDAKSGAITLTLANGKEITCPEITIEEAVFCYVTELPSAEEELKAGSTMTLPIKNGDKLTGVEIAGKSCQYIVSGKNLIVGIPDNAKKGTKVRLISSNGEITYTIDFTPNSEITTVIWTGTFSSGGWAAGLQDLSWGKYDWSKVTAGTELVVTLTADPAGEYHQIRFGNGSWQALPGTKAFEGADGDGNIALNNDVKEYRFALTQAMIDEMVNKGGLVICGAFFIVTKIALVEHISLETTVWEGTAVADNWGNQPYIGADGGADFLEAGLKVGSTIRVYLTATDASWNCQIVDGHWNPNTAFDGCDFSSGNWDLAANGGCISFTVTQFIYDHMTSAQGWGGAFLLNGDNVICTKVTVE